MSNFSKISKFLIYFFITFIFISLVNDQKSSVSRFYYFEKSQDDGIEKESYGLINNDFKKSLWNNKTNEEKDK